MISDDVEEVTPRAGMVILALPSFTHKTYMKALNYCLKPGVSLGAMSGEGCACHILGDYSFVIASNLFVLDTLP
jgi:hypothetical protein